MCDWGSRAEIVIRQHIAVDACLADLIVALNDAGVLTTGCCCGHGKGPGSVTIKPSSADRARELGYTVELRGDLDPEIILPKSVFSAALSDPTIASNNLQPGRMAE